MIYCGNCGSVVDGPQPICNECRDLLTQDKNHVRDAQAARAATQDARDAGLPDPEDTRETTQ